MNAKYTPFNQVKQFKGTTDRYTFLSTEDIISGLGAAGWEPVSQQSGKVRKGSREGFQPHIARFEHKDFQTVMMEGTPHAGKVQLVLTNSHDGTQACRVNLGFYRLVCTNGLVVGKSIGGFRVIHRGDALIQLEEGLEKLVAKVPELYSQINKMAETQLTTTEVSRLAKSVLDKRLDTIKSLDSVNYTEALKPTRIADRGKDLFTVMNILQERLIRGGVGYKYHRTVFTKGRNFLGQEYLIPAGTELRNGRTKAVSNAKRQVELNQLVWDAAMEAAA